MNNEFSIQELAGEIILRELHRGDEQKILDYYTRNKDFHKPWFPAFANSFFTLEHHIYFIRSYEAAGPEKNAWRFGIFDKKEELLIGHINLAGIERGVFQNGRLGYSIDGKYSGSGLMTKAIAGVVEFGFRELNLHRVEANIMPGNISSCRVLEKNGFTKIGHSPEYLRINGIWEDHDMYMKLNRNFSDERFYEI